MRRRFAWTLLIRWPSRDRDGGGTGLGRRYAIGFAQRGALVAVNDIGGDVRGSGSSRSPADEVVRVIRQAGGIAIPSYASIASLEGGRAVVDTALEEFGTVDVVINNAGILRPAPIPDVSRDEIERTVAVHLLGSFYVSHAAFRAMAANSYGRLVFTTSSAALFGIETEVAYAAAKAAVIGLSESERPVDRRCCRRSAGPHTRWAIPTAH